MSSRKMVRVPRAPTASPSASSSVFGDEIVIYCERTERMHCLDAATSVVWALCDGSRNVTEIIDEIVRMTSASRRDVSLFVDRAVAQFVELRLLK